MSSSTEPAAELEVLVAAASAVAERALDADATRAVPDATVQLLITSGARLFARKIENEQRYFSPVRAPNAVTPTEAAILITELLRAVDLNLFDLSMWAGRPRDASDESGTGIIGT